MRLRKNGALQEFIIWHFENNIVQSDDFHRDLKYTFLKILLLVQEQGELLIYF